MPSANRLVVLDIKDNVAFMIWESETAIRIEDKKMNKAFQDHFEVLWTFAKAV